MDTQDFVVVIYTSFGVELKHVTASSTSEAMKLVAENTDVNNAYRVVVAKA